MQMNKSLVACGAALAAAGFIARQAIQSSAKRAGESKTEGKTVCAEPPADSIVVECSAGVNIAVVKYWGKRDEKLILPINDSLSGTIDQDAMRSLTRIVASKSFEHDTMTLNGEAVDIVKNTRLQNVLSTMRKHAKGFRSADGKVFIPAEELLSFKLCITSNNDFPTAAGLASSASGFACLTQCLASLYGLDEPDSGVDLSALARLGSGSACRSMYGGWVQWCMGDKPDGSDSVARLIKDETWWPEMRVLILVANRAAKEVPSTSGMETSVHTSPFIKLRASDVVPSRMERIIKAIEAKDFATFAVETMQDSNSFHSVCEDTWPPITYMNDTSRYVRHMLHKYNDVAGTPLAAYTYDAGPNCVIYTLEHNVERLLQLFVHYLKPDGASVQSFVQDRCRLSSVGQGRFDPAAALPADESKGVPTLPALCAALGEPHSDKKLASVIVTKVGPGPKVLQKTHTFKQ